MVIVNAVEKRASASVMVSNLILTPMAKQIIQLTAYGPSQEVRCFAQLLFTSGTRLSGEGLTLGYAKHIDNSFYRIIPNLKHGHSALYVLPKGCKYLIGSDENECRETFYRLLDQKYFAHRDWYGAVEKQVATFIPATIGSRVCLTYKENIEETISGLLKFGGVQFPTPTTTLSLENSTETK